jgi:hypothetical protein
VSVPGPVSLPRQSGKTASVYAKAATLLGAALLAQLALISAFVGAMSRPTLRHATLASVLDASARAGSHSDVPRVAGFTYQRLADTKVVATASAIGVGR